MNVISVNENAVRLIQQLIKSKKEMGVRLEEVNESTIIDCGVKAKGSRKAGVLISKICTGGLAEIKIFKNREYGNTDYIEVKSDEPIIACLGSQYAGRKISLDGYFAMGSGPARALSDVEIELFKTIKYRDNYDKAVLCLETRSIPTPQVVEYIKSHIRIQEKNIYVLIIPTASLIGSIQISARVLETAIHQLLHNNFPIHKIIEGKGVCPIPPVLPTDINAMGLTNDAIIMMGEVNLIVDNVEDSLIEEIISKTPSVNSDAFGKPFIEIFEKVKYDFYKIDPALFAPAKINVYNLKTNSKFSFGEVEPELYFETVEKYLKRK